MNDKALIPKVIIPINAVITKAIIYLSQSSSFLITPRNIFMVNTKEDPKKNIATKKKVADAIEKKLIMLNSPTFL